MKGLQARSQRSAYELLGAYRVFALAVAALQMVLVAPPDSTRFTYYVIVGVLGVYSIVKVFLPYYRGFRESYLALGVDVVLSVSPLFLTGGLASPFLFYSICPIIYASLTFTKMVAFICAALISVSMVTSLFYPDPSPVNFGFAGIYIIACALVAILPYTTNLSIYRRLEQDAAIKERKRLARELHDSVAQTLAYVNLKASMVTDTLSQGNLRRSLRELDQMKQSLDSTYDEVRQAIDTLGRPIPDEEEVDFVSTLSKQVKEFSRKSGLKTHLTISWRDPKLLPHSTDELLHIVGEAMVNARNHSNGTMVDLGVNSDGELLEVTIKDDGRGFDPADLNTLEKEQEHHGITIMKERAQVLGGELVITSAPGSGTEVKVTIPLDGRWS
ncbi:sensor histidine kinase [Chloroflexota bacterium]